MRHDAVLEYGNMSANIEIIPPGNEKFILPVPPEFSRIGPWLSAISLLLFAVASCVALAYSSELPIWAWAPFLFTAFGSILGFLYELWLIATFRPYQLFHSATGIFIQSVRAANLPFVFGSVYVAFCILTFPRPAIAIYLIIVAGFLAGMLWVVLLFQRPPRLAAILFLLGLVGQLSLVSYSTSLPAEPMTKWLLVGTAVTLFATVVAGSETPERSTVFHLLAIASVVLLLLAYQRIEDKAAYFPQFAFSEAWIPAVPFLRRWMALVLGVIAGLIIGFYFIPKTWNVARSVLASATWPFFYLIVAGGLQVPRPERLSVLYRGKEDQLKRLKVLPYHVAHSRNLSYPISVPCLDEALTLKVHAYGYLTRLVEYVFAIGSEANRLFPFANIHVPLRDKPRMEPWSDGSHYWPRWLLRRIYIPSFGWFQIESGVRGPGIQSTPDSAVEAYQQGQLLAYLVEYGIAGPFIEAIEPTSPSGTTRFKMDFRFLEAYETKPDYERYGGVAYIEIDDSYQQLALCSVSDVGSSREIPVDPNDAAFRHAEDVILASLYFYVVSGKHLAEIHMGLNLVEVAMFNSFDAKRRWDHPVRLMLFPHLYAHELAEELTTQNLLEDGAVFPQIFATTNSELMRHLNDRFSEYQLGRDEDFEHREAVLLAGRAGAKLEDVLPRSSLVWEKEYFSIWNEYATTIVNATYADDATVRADECVQSLFANLSSLFPRELPARYAKFKTRSGLSRFIADTMHHLIIRHEVYGTTGVRLALDPRINKVQVPKDGGPSAIDEWRSLACVAMATSRVRYTKLLINFSNVFADLENRSLEIECRKAHNQLKSRLAQLEEKFNEDGIDNYDSLRLLPSELDIGAGY